MEPLTLTDARHPAIVAAWLDAWTMTHTPSAYMVTTALQVAHERGGLLSTWDGATYTVHASHAALAAYVVTWARGIN